MFRLNLFLISTLELSEHNFFGAAVWCSRLQTANHWWSHFQAVLITH